MLHEPRTESEFVDMVSTCLRARIVHPLWITTNETLPCLDCLISVCEGFKEFELGYWDISRGLTGGDKLMAVRSILNPTNNTAAAASATNPRATPEPWYGAKLISLINDLPMLQRELKRRAAYVFLDMHRDDIVKNTVLLRAIQNSVQDSVKADKPAEPWSLIFMSPFAPVPIEWQHIVTTIQFPLPDGDYIRKVASSLKVKDKTDGFWPTKKEEQTQLIKACQGMTHSAVSRALSLSVAKNRTKLDIKDVTDYKVDHVQQSGLLEVYTGNAKFEDMGGISQFQDYTVGVLKNAEKSTENKLMPRGLLLLGVPGSGKSQAVKCLSEATGRPLLTMNMGALRSKWQGESDANLRNALQIADSMSPCILFIDEIEKHLSGVESSGSTDGGTGARMFGYLLTWLNDRADRGSDVYFVGTCNSITQLTAHNPEFLRPGRFDATFFFDMPDESNREAIWGIHIKNYNVPKNHVPSMAKLLSLSTNWTGAEIEACCRQAVLSNITLEAASNFIIPLANIAGAEINALRKYATNKALSAHKPGLYVADDNNEVNVNNAAKAALSKLNKTKNKRGEESEVSEEQFADD